jgi:hypothetical protein
MHHLATTDGQLKVIGVSKDPDNNDLTAANVTGSLRSMSTS